MFPAPDLQLYNGRGSEKEGSDKHLESIIDKPDQSISCVPPFHLHITRFKLKKSYRFISSLVK